jgi:hypothetical protein
MRLFLISLFALGVMAACGGSGTSSPELTDTPAPDEGEASPRADVPRPAFQLLYDEIAGLAEWVEVEGAEAYELEGEVTWWPDCTDQDVGIPEPQTVPIAETVSAGTRSFALPKPDDARYTRMKEFVLLVSAIDASGRLIGYNNTGQMNELVCQTYQE